MCFQSSVADKQSSHPIPRRNNRLHNTYHIRIVGLCHTPLLDTQYLCPADETEIPEHGRIQKHPLIRKQNHGYNNRPT